MGTTTMGMKVRRWFTQLCCVLLAVHILNVSFDDNDIASQQFFPTQKTGNIIESVIDAVLVHFFNISLPDNNLDNGVSTSVHHIDLIFARQEVTLRPTISFLTVSYGFLRENLIECFRELQSPPPEIA